MTWEHGTPGRRWKGNPCVFPVACFFNTPGVYTLNKGIQDVHDMDRTGLLAEGSPKSGDHPERSAVADTGDDYDRIEKEGGPGQPLRTYLPTHEMVLNKNSSSPR